MSSNIEKSDTRKTILEKAAPLLAAKGYSGVSMRNLSNVVGVSSAAIYHHFVDKETLYLEVMRHAFSDKAVAMTAILDMQGTPLERLEHFINSFVILIDADPDFRALVQREMLDGDETRLKLVAEEVFAAPFQAITSVLEELDTDCDAHFLAVSIIGIIMFHFEAAPILKFLPSAQPMHNKPQNIIKHVMSFLTKAFSADQEQIIKVYNP
ncbi:MAG: TetR/AcrR family transcriptional regulator [Woeseiaceae bacterium]